MRAFANGDHGAATHSLREQCSHGGSERMSVTVCPQPAHRNDPVAVAPFATSVSAAVCSVTATIDPFRRA